MRSWSYFFMTSLPFWPKKEQAQTLICCFLFWKTIGTALSVSQAESKDARILAAREISRCETDLKGRDMGRFPRSKGAHGNLKWIRTLVNERPDLFDTILSSSLRPVRRDPSTRYCLLCREEYAGYPDQVFLDLPGTELRSRPLARLRPAWGPEGDALGQRGSMNRFCV